jgi:hypothetical protein
MRHWGHGNMHLEKAPNLAVFNKLHVFKCPYLEKGVSYLTTSTKLAGVLEVV